MNSSHNGANNDENFLKYILEKWIQVIDLLINRKTGNYG